MTHLVLLIDMAVNGYFVEAGSMGLKPIDSLMITFGAELLTSCVIDAMDEELRKNYLNSLASATNSQIVHISGRQRSYYPAVFPKSETLG